MQIDELPRLSNEEATHVAACDLEREATSPLEPHWFLNRALDEQKEKLFCAESIIECVASSIQEQLGFQIEATDITLPNYPLVLAGDERTLRRVFSRAVNRATLVSPYERDEMENAFICAVKRRRRAASGQMLGVHPYHETQE